MVRCNTTGATRKDNGPAPEESTGPKIMKPC